MNKTASVSRVFHRIRGLASRLIARLGIRLLLLLLAAELPLLAFVVLITLQNDTLRSSDALSQATSLQQSLLLNAGRDVRIATSLAIASASLPLGLLADPDDCRAVLRTLIAPNADYIEQAALFKPDGAQRCNAGTTDEPTLHSAMGAMASNGVDRQMNIQVRDGAIEVSRRFAPDIPPMTTAGRGQTGSIVLRLRSPPAIASQTGVPRPSLWLVQNGQWQPIADAAVGEQPSSTSRLLVPSGAAMRLTSQDRRDYLYAATAVDGRLAADDVTLVAASDVRIAARRTQSLFLIRLAEMAIFFLAEFMLIVAGVDQVITRPLRQLSDSVRSWRELGSFDARGTSHDPIELRDLTGSFAQATQTLSQRERELAGATAQQDLLMKEIHHRVKNNLQIVASLLNLQASRIKVPEARAEFQSARDRVRALATLHRHLYGDGDLHMVDLRAFFAELCSQLFQALGEAEGDRISLRVTAPDINITSDQAVPIALIVTETVGNAIKFAFPGNRRGIITVTFHEDDESGTLVVCDDGVGFSTSPRQDSRAGLGIQLIRGFARQLGASLSVTHEAGTCYRVTMKLERRMRAQSAVANAAPPAIA